MRAIGTGGGFCWLNIHPSPEYIEYRGMCKTLYVVSRGVGHKISLWRGLSSLSVSHLTFIYVRAHACVRRERHKLRNCVYVPPGRGMGRGAGPRVPGRGSPAARARTAFYRVTVSGSGFRRVFWRK